MGFSVDEDGLIKQTFGVPRTEGSDTMNLLKNLALQKDVSMCILCENIDESTESNQVFETYTKGFGTSDMANLDMVNADYDGTDCLKKSAPPKNGMAAGDGEELIHGRIYDKDRIIAVNSQRVFCISVVWIHKRELRTFRAYPEVLIMDDKKNEQTWPFFFRW
jgi:hypothetical protein